MRRTGEKVLSIISMIVYTFTALIAVLMNNVVIDNEENIQKVIQTVKDKNPNATMEEVNFSIDFLSTYVWLMIITSILAMGLGIVALILLHKYQRAKVAGTLFLVMGILGIILTIPLGLLSGPLFIIAGIMCLVRKPKQETELKEDLA